ncbi:MAG: hypothetical protein JWM78_3821 [Verrucomicrobiaceae bacterium]|nr:hypothetical protein [Verrucomicrobiaceae bacterium]
MTNAFAAKLHLPPQDLDAPSLFAPNTGALKIWLEQLPKANLGQTTRALFNAVNELNRVRLSPMQRLQLLESLRPVIHFASGGLRRHYLNQPIQLPEQPQKVARLAHVLHEQLAVGYTLVSAHLSAGGKNGLSPTQQASAIATAIHRALAEHSQNLLRDLQLYRNPHPGCWFTIHQLSKFARECNVLASVIGDTQCGDSSIDNAYLRALLLGSARTNQLRQENLTIVFDRALGWATATTLDGAERGILVVNEDNDDGPIYREFVDSLNEAGWHGLDTSALALELNAQRQRAEENTLGDPALTPELLAHLAQTWSSASTREFLRTAVREPVDISVGLTSTHHFLSGELDFNLLLSDDGHQRFAQPGGNPFMRPKASPAAVSAPKDVWDSPYSAHPGVMNVSLEILNYEMRVQQQKTGESTEREKFRSEAVERLNVSPGGLCITWPPQSKVLLRTGEIVGIRENAQKNWSIGVIRWGKLTDDGPRLGIKLLSPTAVPYGARVVAKTGDQGEYLRVLVLPEIKQIGQPTTLIAPRLPFRVGQKVSLRCRNKETRVQLTRKFASTASFNQFEFRRLTSTVVEPKPNETRAGEHDGAFDNLWDSL